MTTIIEQPESPEQKAIDEIAMFEKTHPTPKELIAQVQSCVDFYAELHDPARNAITQLSALFDATEVSAYALATELYDKYIMGGWEAHEGVPMIRDALLAAAGKRENV